MPVDPNRFYGFDETELNKACRFLKVIAYIFDWEVTDGWFKGSPGCLNWRSTFVEGGIRINMLRYEKHLMFIKDIKCLFKQWSCGKCKRCFDQVCHLDRHIKTCNGGEIKHVWKGGIYELKKISNNN